MSKLLNRPIRAFSWYALLILLCSIPAYFYVVDRIWLTELDEHNHIVKTRIEQRLENTPVDPIQLESMLRFWNVLEPGTDLQPAPNGALQADSIYIVERPLTNEGNNSMDRFRGLQSFILVNGEPYRLRVETNVEEADETLVAIASVTLLFFVLLVIGFIVLSARISRNIWKPFYSTLEKLDAFNLNDHTEVKFEDTDIEEFAHLHRQLQKLMVNNRIAFHQQKAFVENASHELQTPLALLRSKLEMLMQSEQMTQEQSELIHQVNLPLSRISRVTKNLLLLSRIENSQFSEVEVVSIAEVLANSVGMLGDYLVEKDLALEQSTGSDVVLTCNRFLLETVINNLIINGIRHNEPQGRLMISLDNGKLSVSNTGSYALEHDKLFRRFATSSSEGVSSGLGLAIVKEICNRYRWAVSYHFSEGMHTFTVNFGEFNISTKSSGSFVPYKKSA